VAKVINSTVARGIIGADPFDVESIVDRVLLLGDGNVDVVAGVDPALWDIIGKSLDQPLYRLLGGKRDDLVPVDYTLSAAEPTAMVRAAEAVHEQGYQGVVVKATGHSLEQDLQRVRCVRKALPSNCTVRVDCNGSYSREVIGDFISKIADLDIEFIEQPVPADDVEGLRQARAFGVPICVDESLKSPKDALTLLEQEACDVFNIKIPSVGGILLSKRIAAIASAAGVPVVVGGKLSFEISRCVSRHFTVSIPGTTGRKHQGPGPASQSLTDDVVPQRTTVSMAGEAGGNVQVEEKPGLGVDPVWSKVERYTVNR
jgi:L-alanine-DL-glutamate epimerase-like enolase superfamily enzyme